MFKCRTQTAAAPPESAQPMLGNGLTLCSCEGWRILFCVADMHTLLQPTSATAECCCFALNFTSEP